MAGRSFTRVYNGEGNRIKAEYVNELQVALEDDDARIDAKPGLADVQGVVQTELSNNATVVAAAEDAAAAAVTLNPTIASLTPGAQEVIVGDTTGPIKIGVSTYYANNPKYGGIDGGIADVTAINAAIQDAYDNGGGTVVFPNVPTGYGVFRVDGEQVSGIMPKPGVNMHSEGATFHMRDNAYFICCRSQISTTVTITADVAIGDSTFAVDTTAGVVVGMTALLRFGARPGDTPEPMWWTYATVTAVDPTLGTVTLDTAANYAITASTEITSGKRILFFSEMIEDISLTGKWNFINDMRAGEGENAEGGMYFLYCRNVNVHDVVGINVGAGAVMFHFCEGATVNSIHIPRTVAQDGHPSKGRAINCAESRNITVNSIKIGWSDGPALVFLEHLSKPVHIGHFEFENTYGPRATSVFHVAYDSDLTVDNVRVGGHPTPINSTGSISIRTLVIDWPSIYPSTYGFLPSIVQEHIIHNGVVYGPKRRFRRVVAVTSNMGGGGFTIPPGFLGEMTVQVADPTNTGGVGAWGITTPVGAGGNITPSSLQPMTPTAVMGANDWGNPTGGYAVSDHARVRTIYMYTDAGVPAGDYAIWEWDFFPVAGSEPATVPEVPPRLLAAPLAANPDTSGADLATLETEVNQLKAALRSLGLIAT